MIKEMKKVIMMAVTVSVMANSAFAGEWIDRHKITAKENSIEKFALDYMKLFVKGDADKIRKVCDPTLNIFFAEGNGIFLKDLIKRFKKADLTKKLIQRTNPEKDGVTKVEINLKMKSGRTRGMNIFIKKSKKGFIVVERPKKKNNK